MTYPESANVSAGDATLASHYNDLRSDAVLLGKAAADAVSLGTALERYESRLEIERLDTTKLRVLASASAPVSLLIDGYLCQAVANVDLGAGDVPSGVAAAYYIFANRTASSTTFTLTVNTVSTEAASQRRIGRFYWDGSKIVKDSVRSEFSELVADLLYFVDPQICGGRLTLSTGVPVPTSDISSSATVYFSPYSGNRIALYVQDYGWRLYPFSELTLDISGIASGKNIDVWLYDNAGTLTLAYTEWSNDTLRATAITLQDGIYVKSGALSYRYLGFVRTSGAGVSCDTKVTRFIWNYYNRVWRPMWVTESAASWTLVAGAVRYVNNNSNNKLQFVIGVVEDSYFATHTILALVGSGESAEANIGQNGVNQGRGRRAGLSHSAGGTIDCTLFSSLFALPALGYYYITACERSRVGTVGFYSGSEKQKMNAIIRM